MPTVGNLKNMPSPSPEATDLVVGDLVFIAATFERVTVVRIDGGDAPRSWPTYGGAHAAHVVCRFVGGGARGGGEADGSGGGGADAEEDEEDDEYTFRACDLAWPGGISPRSDASLAAAAVARARGTGEELRRAVVPQDGYSSWFRHHAFFLI